jgi:ZIP family zinc transporter
MGAAFGWGLLAASSLVIGSLVAIWLNISLRAIGLIMGFGAGRYQRAQLAPLESTFR